MGQLKSLIFGSILLLMGLSSQAIVRGDLVAAGEATETVFLDLHPMDHLQENCTGVIVNPHLILTAAHCLQFMGTQSQLGISGRSADATTFVSIVKQAKHPQSTKVGNNLVKKSNDIQFDIGYILTKEDLSRIVGSLKFPAILKDRSSVSQLVEENPVQAVGYGLSFPVRPTLRTLNKLKRKLSVQLLGVTNDNYWVTKTNEKDKGQCEGDSGSGLFVLKDQTRFLIGILSGTGLEDSKPFSLHDCGSDRERAAYVVLADHLCWLKKETGIQLAPDLSCN